tara:strand:- start:122 stop:1276 length:1155 start_codon:yes stop_codon:yes gene_type:complete
MREVILISSVILSGLLVFLLFKTMRNETYFSNEINRLNKQVNELNSSLLIQDGLKEKDTLNNSLQETQNSQNNQSNIKQEYDNYVQENFSNDELPNELKDKIDNITIQEEYQQQNNEEYVNQGQYENQENKYNYSLNENLNAEIYDNIEANMERNSNDLQSNSLEIDNLEFSNSDVTNNDLEENENNLHETLTSNLEQSNTEQFNNEGNILEVSNIEDLESSNIQEGENTLELSNIDDIEGLEETTVGHSEGLGENNLGESEGLEKAKGLELSNNDNLNFQLENMQHGLTMEDINEGNNDNNDLINNLIDNALASKEDGENGTIDIENNNDGKDYSTYSLGDFEKLTLKELQDIARQNRLKIKGKKNELVDRVKAHYNFNKNLV